MLLGDLTEDAISPENGGFVKNILEAELRRPSSPKIESLGDLLEPSEDKPERESKGKGGKGGKGKGKGKRGKGKREGKETSEIEDAGSD